MPYASQSDLNQYLGIIPTASGLNKDTFLARAEDEIHMRAIGLYKVPFEVLSSIDSVTSGVATNILKLWNAKLAAGYMIMAASITQENTAVHEYGSTLITNTLEELERMKEQEIVIVGATVDTTPADNLAKPAKAVISSPDGSDTPVDDKSFFNRPYRQVGERSNEVTGGPDI